MTAVAYQKWRNLKRNARKRGIHFDLTILEVAALLQPKKCPTCGAVFDEDHPRSVDRMDPTRGYVVENCRAQCVTCNTKRGSTWDVAAHRLDRKTRSVHAVLAQRESKRKSRGVN